MAATLRLSRGEGTPCCFRSLGSTIVGLGAHSRRRGSRKGEGSREEGKTENERGGKGDEEKV